MKQTWLVARLLFAGNNTAPPAGNTSGFFFSAKNLPVATDDSYVFERQAVGFN